MRTPSGSAPLEVTCQSVKSRCDAGENFLFLDCREPDEYELVHLPQATLLPMSQLMERVGELDGRQQDEIVIHCHHGGRSLQVAVWLRKQGYERACSMSGGIDLWAAEIDPTLPRY